jgi:hypothetical protein
VSHFFLGSLLVASQAVPDLLNGGWQGTFPPADRYAKSLAFCWLLSPDCLSAYYAWCSLCIAQVADWRLDWCRGLIRQGWQGRALLLTSKQVSPLLQKTRTKLMEDGASLVALMGFCCMVVS